MPQRRNVGLGQVVPDQAFVERHQRRKSWSWFDYAVIVMIR